MLALVAAVLLVCFDFFGSAGALVRPAFARGKGVHCTTRGTRGSRGTRGTRGID